MTLDKPCKDSWRAQNKDGYHVMHKPTYGESLEHRFIYKNINGELLSTEVVRHTCNNTWCIEPTHLIKGTQADNIWDSVLEGTHKNPSFPGSKNPMACLTEEDVVKIRQEAANGIGYRYLARIYKVNRITIHNIITRKTWKHVGEEANDDS